MGRLLCIRERSSEGAGIRQMCGMSACGSWTPYGAGKDEMHAAALAERWTRLSEFMPDVLLCPRHSTYDDRLAFFKWGSSLKVTNIRELGDGATDRFLCGIDGCNNRSPFAPGPDSLAVAQLAGWFPWNGILYCPSHSDGEVQEFARKIELLQREAEEFDRARMRAQVRMIEQATEQPKMQTRAAIPAIPTRRRLRGVASRRG